MLDQLATTLKRNMLKWHAGHEIFCPRCQGILDARRAVELDFNLNAKLVKSKIICAKCFDAVIKPNLAESAGKLPEGVTVEVIDGRELFARPKRAKKAPKPSVVAVTPADAEFENDEVLVAEQLPLTA